MPIRETGQQEQQGRGVREGGREGGGVVVQSPLATVSYDPVADLREAVGHPVAREETERNGCDTRQRSDIFRQLPNERIWEKWGRSV